MVLSGIPVSPPARPHPSADRLCRHGESPPGLRLVAGHRAATAPLRFGSPWPCSFRGNEPATIPILAGTAAPDERPPHLLSPRLAARGIHPRMGCGRHTKPDQPLEPMRQSPEALAVPGSRQARRGHVHSQPGATCRRLLSRQLNWGVRGANPDGVEGIAASDGRPSRGAGATPHRPGRLLRLAAHSGPSPGLPPAARRARAAAARPAASHAARGARCRRFRAYCVACNRSTWIV